MRYCRYCQRMVAPKKDVSMFPLILLTFLTGGTWLIVYGIYYFMFKGESCPICGGKEWK